MTMDEVRAGSWRRAVVASYDQQASRYSSHRRMQDANYRHLVDKVIQAAGEGFRPHRVLDIGCGDGQMSSLLLRDIHGAEVDLFGMDPAVELLCHGRSLGSTLKMTAADARLMPYKSRVFDLVVANSVLHWLNAPDLGLTPLDAIREAARVLRPGGVFGASIAASETSAAFGRAFDAVVTDYLSAGNQLTDHYRRDPVGGMDLATVVNDLLEADLEVLQATLEWEPVLYSSPEDYLADVRGYGFSAYSAGFQPGDADARYDAIERTFLNECPAGPYRHDQYMVYVVASHPSR
jgi:ubiquinone/menaquinone biosynthesis C-methylase UbiE